MAQPTFNEWRKDLSRTVNSVLGKSMNKLPDFPLRDWWKDGVSTRDAVEIIRDEIGEYELEDEGW
jgi:hypothetical protein